MSKKWKDVCIGSAMIFVKIVLPIFGLAMAYATNNTWWLWLVPLFAI